MSNSNQKLLSPEDITDLYKKNLRGILSYVYGFVHNEEDAKEYTQDVFYKFYSDIKQKDMRLDNPKAYLYRIARNYCIDILKKKKIEMHEFNENVGKKTPSHTNSTEDKFVNKIILDTVIDYVETNLTELESSIFKLKFTYQMKLEDISYVTDVSISSASRIIKKIIKKLEEEFPDIV